jgi:hypothetical protein
MTIQKFIRQRKPTQHPIDYRTENISKEPTAKLEDLDIDYILQIDK